jgi:predicted house-cleaning noncanonical NTP pyrophosphatase (MazG superfamily)
MKTKYNKLIRDGIPEIIDRSNCQYEITILSNDDYLIALGEKLIEEATEVSAVLKDSPEKLIDELADLQEVIDALLMAAEIDREAIAIKQKEKRELRGAFKGKIKLLWTEPRNERV